MSLFALCHGHCHCRGLPGATVIGIIAAHRYHRCTVLVVWCLTWLSSPTGSVLLASANDVYVIPWPTEFSNFLDVMKIFLVRRRRERGGREAKREWGMEK